MLPDWLDSVPNRYQIAQITGVRQNLMANDPPLQTRNSPYSLRPITPVNAAAATAVMIQPDICTAQRR